MLGDAYYESQCLSPYQQTVRQWTSSVAWEYEIFEISSFSEMVQTNDSGISYIGRYISFCLSAT